MGEGARISERHLLHRGVVVALAVVDGDDDEDHPATLREALEGDGGPPLDDEPLPFIEADPPESPNVTARRRAMEDKLRERRERDRIARGDPITRAEEEAQEPEPEEQDDAPDSAEAPVLNAVAVEASVEAIVDAAQAQAPQPTAEAPAVQPAPQMRPMRPRTYKLGGKRHLRLGDQQVLPMGPGYWRPKARTECETAPRPCPYVGCEHHLFLDETDHPLSLKFNFPDLEDDRVMVGPLMPGGQFFSDGRDRVVCGPFLEEMPSTCALDVALDGSHTQGEVAEFFNITRERVRQLEVYLYQCLREHFTHRELLDLFGDIGPG